MDIRIRHELTSEEIPAVQKLVKACEEKEPLTLSFPYEDRDTQYFLGYEDGLLVSVMVLCELDENVYESIAWTLPEYRKKGCFREMWEKASRILRNGLFPDEKVRVHFVCDHMSPAAEHVIRSLNANLLSEEYQMSVALKGKNTLPDNAGSEFTCLLLREEADSTRRYAVTFKDSSDSRPVLTFSVIPDRQKTGCYLYEFVVRKDLRNQKYGTRIFPLVLNQLKEEGFDVLSLQVSSHNVPALRLYKNAGLSADVTLTYYELVL